MTSFPIFTRPHPAKGHRVYIGGSRNYNDYATICAMLSNTRPLEIIVGPQGWRRNYKKLVRSIIRWRNRFAPGEYIVSYQSDDYYA